MIEHFGRWGTKAENFLQHLSQQSANPEANFNASMFMSYQKATVIFVSQSPQNVSQFVCPSFLQFLYHQSTTNRRVAR